MGTSQSKPFAKLSSKEISRGVASLGSKYETYAKVIDENGVDGAFLLSLSPEELEETLEDLEINSRLHRRVLLKEFKKKSQEKPSLFRYPDYDLDALTPASELNVYDEITTEVAEHGGDQAAVAAVNLIIKEGQLSLSSKVRTAGTSKLVSGREHRAASDSFCYRLLNDGNPGEDFYLRSVPPDLEPEGTSSLTYSGFVIRDENRKRIGIVCIIESARPEEIDQESRRSFLREMAEQAQHELQLRKALVNRKSSLEKQIQNLKSREEEIVLQASGPFKAVRRSQVKRRLSLDAMYHYPSPQDVPMSSVTRESSKLQVFRSNRASGRQLAHLPPDFFAPCEQLGMVKPPIHRNDMERCANSEALGLFKKIRPGCELATQLKQYVELASRMFGFAHVSFNFQGPAHQYSVCWVDRDPTVGQMMLSLGDAVSYEEDRETPFMLRFDRAISFCNYALASAQTFVVHDIAQDKATDSFACTPVKAYAGSPIKDAGGRVIGVLCMVDIKPRPDFTAAHEIQMEQVCRMALQCIENWLLRLDIERLEAQRTDLMSDRDKTVRPKGNVTIVYTDIQGSTALWETNPQLMRDAQDVHDAILRRVCSEHHGYEIDTEGDSFQLAFHDPVDAVQFALKTQMTLFGASWSSQLLDMSNARDDDGAFRGLRVRMGIHQGDVETLRNEVTGRTMYSGEAVGIAKSLESVAHGGQIIVSSSTWDVAQHFADTSFDEPQVIDLGTHVIKQGQKTHEGVISQRLIQLVPKALSYDYFHARSLRDPEVEIPSDRQLSHPSPRGRQFHPPKSLKCISPSFHDAPFGNNEVTIAYINMNEVDNQIEDPRTVKASLVQMIGQCLDSFDFGYQCHDDMLAFDTPSEAITFGLHLVDMLKERDFTGDGIDLGSLIRYGCVHDKFLTMGPHKTTGRADYFGKVVNRASRIANVAELGSVFYGIVRKDDVLRSLDRSIRAEFVDMRTLDGVREVGVETPRAGAVHDEMAIYECTMRCSHARQ